MYTQFLYIITGIFIFAAYPGAETTNFSLKITLVLALFSWAIFIFFTRLQFLTIKKKAGILPHFVSDRKIDAAVARYTISALIFFATDIYILNLPDFLQRLTPFAKIPTFSAAACMSLYIGRLCVIWKYSHGVSRMGPGARQINVRSYIASNLRMSAPVLLPWITFSMISDLMAILPLGRINAFLSSPAGEGIYVLIFLIIITVVGPFFIHKLWQCTPLQNGYTRDRIHHLFSEAGVPVKDILIWPIFGGKMITAGIMGLIKQFRYILITPALLQLLDSREIDAVVAHEIGHIKKKHLIFYFLFFIGYMILSLFFFRIFFPLSTYLCYTCDLIRQTGISPSKAASLLLNVMFITGFVLYFRFLFGYFIRNFERQADAWAVSFTGNAYPLATTLEKIAAAGHIAPEKPNWHHFSIGERIAFLLDCEKDRSCITRHDRSIRKSIAVFVIGLLILGGIESALTFSEAGDRISTRLHERIILARLAKLPGDAVLLGELGDLYQASGRYSEAAEAYTASLRLNPENPTILNNLAWLLSTCPDPDIKNASQALEIALKAVELELSPHILDTLAECYFANGLYEQAVEAGKKALGLASPPNDYYRDQLQKFESGRRNKDF